MASLPRSIAAKIDRKEFISCQAREVLTSRTHHMKFPTLQQLSANCLWINKNLLIDFSDSDKKFNPFEAIPNQLKTYLHEKFSCFVDLITLEENAAMNLALQTTNLLLNKELVKFTVPKLFLAREKNTDLATSLWNNLVLQCPNLQEMHCHTYFRLSINDQAAFLNSLMSMANLQIVELERIACDDTHLCSMAEQMPNLRVLEIVLDDIATGKGFIALSNLHYLEEFIFFVEVDTIDLQTQFTRNNINRSNFKHCLQTLPKLHFAGERFNHYLPMTLKNIGLATEMELQSKKTLTLGLQEATLSRASSIPDGISLPNLTSLHLLEPSRWEVFHWDCRLSSITELGLYEVSMETCINILSQTERRVKKLFLYVKDDTILVDRIFHLCPNLERFSVVLSPRRVNLVSPIEPNTLRHLKVLELIMLIDSTEFVVDPEALMQLLQAPELRHLELTKITLQQRETDEIVRRLQQGEILQKLEHVILHAWHTSADDLYEVASNRMNSVLSSMVLCCPKLTRVFNFTNCFFRGRMKAFTPNL